MEGYYSPGPLPLAGGSVQPGTLGSGAVVAGNLGSGSVRSGNIASGQLGGNHYGSGSVQSGHVGSGQISTYHLASGACVMHAQEVTPVFSGGFNTLITSEAVSGIKAVCLDLLGSGLSVKIAMASVSGRWPAAGVVYDNVSSGIQCNIHTQGVIRVGSGYITSGIVQGKRLFLGRSGEIVTLSGSFHSGGFLSGDMTQALGVLQFVSSGSASGTMLINVSPVMVQALSGLIPGSVLFM